MKRRCALLLASVLALMISIPAALCENETWNCSVCGRTGNTGNFCGTCANPSPVPASDHEVITATPEPVHESATPWLKRDLTGLSVSLKPYPDNEQRRMAYFGPDKNKYPGAKSYRPSQVTSATAIFRDGYYVLVDLVYHEQEKRVVYFSTDSLQAVPAELETAPSTTCAAKTRKATTATMGPGWDYEAFETQVNAGTELKVLFECNDWVFAEFAAPIGTVRAWLPVEAVTE